MAFIPDNKMRTPRMDPAMKVTNRADTAANGETKKSMYWFAGL